MITKQIARLWQQWNSKWKAATVERGRSHLHDHDLTTWEGQYSLGGNEGDRPVTSFDGYLEHLSSRQFQIAIFIPIQRQKQSCRARHNFEHPADRHRRVRIPQKQVIIRYPKRSRPTVVHESSPLLYRKFSRHDSQTHPPILGKID